jgi:hypothetical protein
MSGALWWLYDVMALPFSIGLLDLDNHQTAIFSTSGDSLPVSGAEGHVQR